MAWEVHSMPRHLRLALPGQPLHVIQRGNNRGPCFLDPRDNVLYLGLLAEEAEACGCAIHAYVLMTNHTHLLLTPGRTDSASRMMKHIGEKYVLHFNRRHDRTGTLWEGRFRSCVVDTELYLLRCQRYIELNPVRAGMVSRPSAYHWTSYRANAGHEASTFLQPHPVYLALARAPQSRCARYREFFKEPLSWEQIQEIRDMTNGGYALGR